MRCWVVVALVAWSGPALGADTWSTPFPGITHLHRTGPDNLNLHAAVIDLCAPGVSVRHTAFEERKKRTSVFATSVGAQLAINADWSCRPVDVNPATSPFPPCIGRPEYVTYGIAAHAGVPWPETLFLDAVLAFGAERAQIYDNSEDKQFDPAWMQEVLSGHWSTALDGQLLPNDCPIDPRTSVGLSADGNKLVVIVVDGRGSWRGMTCLEAAAVLIELGASRAFNLDGGGSSTFWLAGQGVKNHPSDGNERVVGSHLAIYATGAGPSPHCERPSVLDPTAPLPALNTVGLPARLVPQVPVRLFDTRQGSAGLEGFSGDPIGRVLGGTAVSFSPGLDAASAGVVLNVTAADAVGDGYLTLWPQGLPMPEVSLLNYGVSVPVANSGVVARLPGQGASIYTHATTHLIADLTATFGPSGSGFLPTTPYRALDTRAGPPLEPLVPFQILPPSSATAAVLGVTTVAPAAAGFLTVYPCDQPVPATSNLNYSLGETRAGLSVAAVGATGVCAVSSVATHLLVDVFGTFAPTGGLSWQAALPVRLVDTRNPTGRWTGKAEAGVPLRLAFRDMPGFSELATGVTLGVTVTSPRADGYLALGPCGTPVSTSNLNFRENQTVANAVWMGLDDEGALCLTASARTHVLIDLTGIFVSPPAPPPVDEGPVPTGPDVGQPDASQGDVSSAPEVVGGGDASSPVDVDSPADAPDATAVAAEAHEDVVAGPGDTVEAAENEVGSLDTGTSGDDGASTSDDPLVPPADGEDLVPAAAEPSQPVGAKDDGGCTVGRQSSLSGFWVLGLGLCLARVGRRAAGARPPQGAALRVHGHHGAGRALHTQTP